MSDEFREEWRSFEKERPDLSAWINSAKLTEHEAEAIKNSIIRNDIGYGARWLEVISTRIDRAVLRSQRRIEQTASFRLQEQNDRIRVIQNRNQ
ncbi:hypothetical protein R70723_27815 [Paenibacillus sp. FSL R7-0273]|uniref:hypothetical protein n=1 Tax=Paenibacillus sp. FSL R7-0273 TaxID=1536772 RepID=UPI0004F859F4|nr:hypothetical protein [Paenibacillus sp. FSL R7-0273]AIQ49275.1 hypothetical protein R70723_27815 [Paenibacillus sp. FSL R7-0273]OMF88046.1 hypothetical protein BK144_22865 [Paenibacillus sp. FSL R7-0273]